jgi:hypothetical protein
VSPLTAARVRAKKISATAAAIEAGFRKNPVRQKLTRVERILKAIAKWIRIERRALWSLLKKEFGSR